MKFLFNAVADLTALLFPVRCCACNRHLNRGESELCTMCLFQLPFTDHHLHRDNRVARKLWGRAEVAHAMSLLAFKKGNLTQGLVHRLKYKGRRSAGIMLGRMIGRRLEEAAQQHEGRGGFRNIDLIIPVPLHKTKQRMRGFNQSYFLAVGIAEHLCIPVSTTVLLRTRAGSSQTTRNRYDRTENLCNAFQLKKPGAVAGKHILLVDDVITTGATLEACCLALQPYRPKRVSIAALASAD
ncbi:ComF family protein [Pedobacter deserti]|uniref:ComF family protein n=1 Tax=Pedobacter deserti TaxID=2817382 RepID=UPI00210ABDF4